MTNQISDNIVKLLTKKNLKLSSLAKKMGVSRQRVSYMFLFKEDKNWTIANLKTIADVLKIDFKDFIMRVVFNEKK